MGIEARWPSRPVVSRQSLVPQASIKCYQMVFKTMRQKLDQSMMRWKVMTKTKIKTEMAWEL